MAWEAREARLACSVGWSLPDLGVDAFVDPLLLEGEFDDTPARGLAMEVDASLRDLAGPEAALDLAIGRGLHRLVSSGWFRDLGHSRLRDFAPARYGFSWAHGRELRDIVVGLERLPHLRQVFEAGALVRSKVRELVRVATPSDELGWIGLARRASVRDLKKAIVSFRAGGAAPEHHEDPDEFVRVRWRASQADAAAWLSWGREMLRTVTGIAGPDWQLAEVLAADTLARLGADDSQDNDHRAPLRAPPGRRHRGGSRPEAPMTPSRLAALAHRSKRWWDVVRYELGAWDAEQGVDAWDVHERLLHLVAMRHALEFARSRLLLWAHDRKLYRELGFASCEDYVLRAHGLAPREVQQAVSMHGELLALPALSRAWHQGKLGPAVVALLARVVTPSTEEAWIAHACANPLKRLELEVDWHLALRSTLSWTKYLELSGGLPVPEIPTAQLRLDWEEFFGVREAERERQRRKAEKSKAKAKTKTGKAAARDSVNAGGVCPAPDAASCGGVAEGGVCPVGEAVPCGGVVAEGVCLSRDAAGCERDLPGGACPTHDGDPEPSPELDDPPELLAALRRRRFVSFRAPPSAATIFGRALRAMRRATDYQYDDGTLVCLMLVECPASKRAGGDHVALRGSEPQPRLLAESGGCHVSPAHASAAEEAPHRREHRIQARDGFVCAMPHCRSRTGLHGHHVKFRSHGGPDDDWNLITLCAGCHRILHDGKVAISGTAPDGLTIFVGWRDDGSPREVYRAA